MATEDKLVPTTLKLISSFKCDINTLRPKADWKDTMRAFSNYEKDEFESFCYEYGCDETLDEFDTALGEN